MQDFASAAMVRLLLRAGPKGALPGAPVDLPAGARVPLATKRDAVAAWVAHAGLSGLMAQAARVDGIAGEPLHQALLLAHTPHDFAQRWRRLERYVHATHAVQIVDAGASFLEVEHGPARAAPRQAPPLPVESLTVAGAWVGALQAIGTRGLRLHIDGQPVFPGFEAAVLAGLVRSGRAQRWQWRWTSLAGAAGPAADEGRATHRASDAGGRHALGLQLPWPDPAAAVARQVLADPAAVPSLAALASTLGLAPRSLQRRLAAQGAGLRFIVGEVRARVAAWWLLHTDHALAEIGFLSGYTDQPHFTREFTRRAGAPPAAWRAAARGSPGAPGGR